MPQASDSRTGLSAYIASEYCRPLLLGPVPTHGYAGDTGLAGGSCTAAETMSNVRECLAHSLTDMRPAENVPVYVMLPLDTVSCGHTAVSCMQVGALAVCSGNDFLDCWVRCYSEQSVTQKP